MKRFVIDASVAVKWVLTEPDTAQAVALRPHDLAAPDLILAECANVLWKKVRRGQFTAEAAMVAVRLLARAQIELVPTRSLLREATRLAIALAHPAYDCFYLALAAERRVPFVAADDALRRKLEASGERGAMVVSLGDAARALAH